MRQDNNEFEQIDTRSIKDNIVNVAQFYKNEGRKAVLLEQASETTTAATLKQIINIETHYYQFSKYQLKQPKCFNSSYTQYMR